MEWIFVPSDARALEEAGLSSAATNGKRRVHKRRLHRSSDEEHRDLPLPEINKVLPEDCFASVPENLFSLQTLEYLGFSKSHAGQIWGNWVNWPAQDDAREISGGRVTFLSLAHSHIRNRARDDGWADSDDDDEPAWRSIMEDCGMNRQTQDAIMSPSYKDVRYTQSCVFWMLDTIDMRYRGLKEIQAFSRQRAQETSQAPATGPAIHTPSSSSSAPSAQQSVSISMQRSSSVQSENATSLAAREDAPGSTVLYKGVDKARYEECCGADGTPQSVSPLGSRPGCDFTSLNMGWYWAVDHGVALRYAQYAKLRDASSGVVIVKMSIKNAPLKSLPEDKKVLLHWDNKQWKQLVSTARQKKPLEKDLRHLRSATLLIGHICHAHDKSIAWLSSYEEMKEEWLMKNDRGGLAVQYVFVADDGLDFQNEHGLADLKAFPLTSQELEVVSEDASA